MFYDYFNKLVTHNIFIEYILQRYRSRCFAISDYDVLDYANSLVDRYVTSKLSLGHGFQPNLSYRQWIPVCLDGSRVWEVERHSV